MNNIFQMYTLDTTLPSTQLLNVGKVLCVKSNEVLLD